MTAAPELIDSENNLPLFECSTLSSSLSLCLSLQMSRRRKLKLKDLVGILKDKASLSKAAILSKPNTSSLHFAILRATTHNPSIPPQQKHITALLSFGYSSRTTASTCIEALMDRLQKTQNSFVAFKCLITVHHIIKRGSFILQDQLSIYPTNGGRNYLNLSNFRDNSTPETWELSSLVRWYARVLEYLLLTSRVLGSFILGNETAKEDDDKIFALLNTDLLKEIGVFVGLIEEICRAPELIYVGENNLVYEVMEMVGDDYKSLQKGILIRLNEVKERLDSLSFGDSVDLVSFLKRLESCTEKLSLLFLNRKGGTADLMWDLIGEMKEKLGGGGEERRIVRREKMSESARLGERVVRSGEPVLFLSGRFQLDRIPVKIVE